MKGKMTIDLNGIAIPVMAQGVNEEVDGTSASAASAVLDANEETVARIAAVGAIRVLVGATPTALATSMAMAAGTVEYFRIPANHKIAVLGGKATITKMV